LSAVAESARSASARTSESPKERTDARLKITEIFFSIQGEAQFSGWPTVFVRLTGCPLRCRYCDTEYAFSGGEWRTLGEIEGEVRRFGTPYVCVTGGEPLAQPRCNVLLTALCDAGYRVSLETSGAFDIGAVDERVSRVVDIKTPGSGEQHRNHWPNLTELTPRDALKLVICDRDDYEWAKHTLAERIQRPDGAVPLSISDGSGSAPAPESYPIFFSPSYEQLSAATLAEWILEDRLPVRLQVQLHKVLWGDVPGR
jgi:7-carboxy-7-deazaguanine synthase